MEVQSPIIQLQSFSNGAATEPANETNTPHTSIPKVKPRNIIFDTLNVQFHFHTLLYQLAAHLLMPLFPILANLDGQVGFGFMNFLGAYVAPCACYIMVISYAVFRDHNDHYIQGAFVTPLIYFLQHRFVISMKYASLSTSEYNRFMHCDDMQLANTYLRQMQLFTGWYQLDPNVVKFELAAASARMGARINEIDIHIDNPDTSVSASNQLRAWNAFLRGHDVIDFDSTPCKQLRRMKDGSYALSVYHMCEALVLRSGKNRGANDERTGLITSFFNILNLSIPLLLMILYYNPSNSAAHWACLVLFYTSSSMLNWYYAQLFYVLLYGAIVDVYRRKAMMTDLNSMIRVTDITLDVEVSSTASSAVTAEQLRMVEHHIDDIMSITEEPEGCHGEEGMLVEPEGHNGNVSPAAASTSTSPPLLFPTMKMLNTTAPASQTSSSAHTHTTDKQDKRGSVLGERIYRDNELPLLPRINFDHSHNIVAWTHARLVMQNFGERFRFRIELYVIASITMLVIMMAVGLLNMGMAADRMTLFFTPWFLQTLLSVTMCIAFNVAIMHTGSAVNESLESHSQTMCTHSLRLHRKIESLHSAMHCDTSSSTDALTSAALLKEAEKLGEVAEKLEAMRSVVETNTQQRPYKVFGFTAQSSLTVSILTTALSFYGILISLLFNDENQALSAVA